MRFVAEQPVVESHHFVQFRNVDNRVYTLKLVQLGYTRAAMFTADGHSVQPREVTSQRVTTTQKNVCARQACDTDTGVGSR